MIITTLSCLDIFQVLDLVAFICASIWIYWGPYGAAWAQFVTMAAFITTLLLFGFHVTTIIHKLPGPWGLIVSQVEVGMDCMLTQKQKFGDEDIDIT